MTWGELHLTDLPVAEIVMLPETLKKCKNIVVLGRKTRFTHLRGK